MKISLRTLALISILTCTVLGRAADAKPAAELVSISQSARVFEPLSISVDFPGGTIDKLLVAVAKADGVSFNIINADQSPDFAKVELPAFSLRNVNLSTVIAVLGELVEPRGFKLNQISGGDPNSWVCVLQRRETPREKQTAPTTQFLSFQLAPFLTAQSVDDIVGAIHAAWELEPTHDRDALHVKFHPGTSILLVSGPGEAIYLTRSVLAELKRPPEHKPAAQSAEPLPEKR